MVEPGITTKALDLSAEEFIRSHEGAEPAFKGYQGFPATLCTSINEQCVHGIPGDRTLNEGDIVALDCGVLLESFYTDACVTVPVGEIGEEEQKLLSATEEALNHVLPLIKEGVRVGDISSDIQHFVEERGFTIVRSLTGHGLGRSLHQFPDIPNYGEAGNGAVLPAGTIVAIEPITSAGKDFNVVQADDGWTLSMRDSALSAHFEHTIIIGKEGCEVVA
jgi:methionyl aminopeptidase